MVYHALRSMRTVFLLICVLWMGSFFLFPQSPEQSSPAPLVGYDLYLTPSWSRTYHHSLEQLRAYISSLPQEEYGRGALALEQWYDAYMRLSPLLYRSSDEPMLRSQINGMAAEFFRALSALPEPGQDPDAEDAAAQARLLSLSAACMPLLRPDLDPGFGFWPALVQEDIEPFRIFQAAAGAGYEDIVELVDELAAASAYRLALTNTSSPRFPHRGEDPQSSVFRLFHADVQDDDSEPSQASEDYHRAIEYIQADGGHGYSRMVLEGVRNTFVAEDDASWRSYLQSIQRLEIDIENLLPSDILGDALTERLVLPNGQFSDAYWALMGLLEFPYEIENSDRRAQIEQLFLYLLEQLQRQYPERLEIYPIISPNERSPARYPMGAQGQLRNYALVLVSGREEGTSESDAENAGVDSVTAELARIWSRVSRGIEDAEDNEEWLSRCGIFVLDAQRLPEEMSQQGNQVRLSRALSLVAWDAQRYSEGEQFSDPALAYALAYRRILILRDLRTILQNTDQLADLDLAYQLWLNGASYAMDLLSQRMTIDLQALPQEITNLVGLEEAEAQLSARLWTLGNAND